MSRLRRPALGARRPGTYRIKIASQEWEFQEIHRLNHLTFAEEIPQHEPVPSGRLVDKFHDENTYIIAIRDEKVVAMTAIRATRPFSLDGKLEDLDRYLPRVRHACEIRLLAVRKEHRSTLLLQRLLRSVWRHCLTRGYDLAVISATTRQLKLYRHLGFVPFGPLVGSPNALFQPMMITVEAFATVADRLLVARSRRRRRNRRISFLPGPVPPSPAVRKAFAEEAVSHRSAEFDADLAAARSEICRVTNARHAVVLLGSGTLANDAIAGQLSLLGEPGLVLSNGEFGDRLVDHAERFRLRCDILRWNWGHPFDLTAVEMRLRQEPKLRWLWFVQLETSTGMLNDLGAIRSICRDCSTKLCVDSISAVGTTPVDLGDAYFGSAVSGKALGAFPGLAIVLHNHRIEAHPRSSLPRYVDLAAYSRGSGVPYTHSSNLIRALKAALGERTDWSERFRSISERSRWLRRRLTRLGFDLVTPEAYAAPGVLTIAVPKTLSAEHLALALDEAGYVVATKSEYLRRRNWMQISTMAAPSYRRLRLIADTLAVNRASLWHAQDALLRSRRNPASEVRVAAPLESPFCSSAVGRNGRESAVR